MDGLSLFWSRSDGVGRLVGLLLLAMSVLAWVLIVWKAWLLRRAQSDIAQGMAAFWDSPSVPQGQERLRAFDREGLLLPLVVAAAHPAAPGTLESTTQREAHLTRHLRDALHRALAQLHAGQVVLASIGSTAPFVGLFGTVWGIYQALAAIGQAGSFALDKVAGPIAEALIMTAAGIAVAVPAVLAYNLFGRWIAQCDAELEGFAHDLRQLLLDQPA